MDKHRHVHCSFAGRFIDEACDETGVVEDRLCNTVSKTKRSMMTTLSTKKPKYLGEETRLLLLTRKYRILSDADRRIHGESITPSLIKVAQRQAIKPHTHTQLAHAWQRQSISTDHHVPPTIPTSLATDSAESIYGSWADKKSRESACTGATPIAAAEYKTYTYTYTYTGVKKLLLNASRMKLRAE